MNRFIMALAALCTLALPAAASADPVPFSYPTGDPVAGLVAPAGLYNLIFSGTDVLNIVNGDLNLTVGAAGAITDITGTVNSQAVSGISPYGGADNILYALDGPSLVSFGGISFNSGEGQFNVGNMFDGGGGLQYGIVSSGNNATASCCFLNDGVVAPITMHVAAVPEPATWAMMLLGFGGVGMAMRRQRKPALMQIA